MHKQTSIELASIEYTSFVLTGGELARYGRTKDN